jgi:hypothetical protein
MCVVFIHCMNVCGVHPLHKCVYSVYTRMCVDSMNVCSVE